MKHRHRDFIVKNLESGQRLRYPEIRDVKEIRKTPPIFI